MGNGPARVVVVGLEMGDGQLIRAWSAADLLPNFKRLFEEGSWGFLETTADELHISAWPSIYTGAKPGDHGVYFTFQPAPGLQGYKRFHEGIYGRPTFWSLLDRANRRCVVLDPPYSHAEPGFGGSYIHDWGTWAHYLAPGSVPADLLPCLEKACGVYPLGLEANDLGFARLDPNDMSRRLVKSVEAKSRAVRWLMDERPWELFFTVFGETHVAGHYCWSADLKGEATDASSAMFPVYASLDRAIGELRDAAGPETTLIVVSGDRCGPNYAGWHLLPDVLDRLGCAGGKDQGDGASPAPTKQFDPVKALRDLLPKDFRKSLARRLPTALRDKLAQRVDTADIDWSRTSAFCLPTDLEGYIRVNLRGREPQGIVAPGEEYGQLLQSLTASLLELRNVATGSRIVRRVIVADDAFPGDRRAQLPDLIVQWDSVGPIAGITSERIGVVSGESPDTRSGTHCGPGFVAVAGPGVSAGATLQAASILDLAPSILARMGVEAPPAMQGRIWRQLTES